MMDEEACPSEIILHIEENPPNETLLTEKNEAKKHDDLLCETKPAAILHPSPPRIMNISAGSSSITARSPSMSNRKHKEQGIKVGSIQSFDMFRPAVFFDVREFGGAIQSNPKKKILVITGRHIYTVDERSSNMCRVSLKLSLREIREITFKEHRHTSVRVSGQSVMWFTPLAKDLARVISKTKSKVGLSPLEALQMSEPRARLPTTLEELKAYRRLTTVDSVSYLTQAFEQLTSNCFSRRRKQSHLYEGLPTLSPR
jgi:hypothetical protein